MADGWIEVDGAVRTALPEWARSDERTLGVLLSEHGVALLEPTGGSVAAWAEVLGVALVDEPGWSPHVFVLVPRRPPAPPWFAVTEPMLPADLRPQGLAAFARLVQGRSSVSSYRRAALDRPRLPLDELLRRVLARQEVPGAVEVPIASFHGGQFRFGSVGTAALGGGGIAGYFGLAIGMPLVQAAPLAALGAIGALAAGGAYVMASLALFGAMPSGRKRKERVLVLAPDGCVCGFYEGVRALDWDDVAAFETGTLGGEPCLVVRGRAAGRVGRVERRWFSQPLDLIVAVAEAYRKRASAG